MITSTDSTLRPGLLVSLNTSVAGNVQYDKRELEADHLTEDGKRRARWETERVIEDPEEHARALKVRNKCLSLIRLVCVRSAFGLLCAEIDEPKLRSALREAQRLAEEFNETAKLNRVKIHTIIGRVAADDVEAVKAINSEISQLMRNMETGIEKLDVKAVREAAAEAKNRAQMLSPDAAARVQTAIDLARQAATRIKAAGEAAAIEIDRATIARIAEQRTAFIDLDDAAPIQKPTVSARTLDLEPLLEQ
jgi:hypothetical protein